MQIFAYITPECATDADKHGFASEVITLREKIEADQSTGSWDRVLPSPFIRKKLGSFRLVAEQRQIGDSVVVCFRALMARGDSKYTAFIASPNAFFAELDQRVLSKWLDERMTSPPTPLVTPSATEEAFLYLSNRGHEGPVVFETSEWVERVGELPREARGWLLDLLREVVDGQHAEPIATSPRAAVAVLFKKLQHNADTLLLAPILGGTATSQQELLGLQVSFAKLLKNNGLSDTDVRRVSRRAYPAVVLADDSLWFAIESDAAANLALSPEELSVLESVFYDVGPAAETSPRFPLFINGRPGSGKSTVLQYMFAEFLGQHLAQGGPGDGNQPLYLTYSDELLRHAVNAVEKLVRCNASIQLGTGAIPDASIKIGIAKSFRLLHEYARELLPPDEGIVFAPDKRLTFPSFRRMWQQKARAPKFRRLAPELVWHVLRTYIKGMRDEYGDYLDVDGYRELPAKRRTVPVETYQQVFEDVWEGWFGEVCNEEFLWDDQDLTRRALDVCGPDLARHPVVFCDEAQDFTRNELELIARLSVFTKRSLRPQEIRRVPIAFAGDPFQTLNPTGFQWASVGARFHEQIVKELDPTEKCRLGFNFKELAFNYRSTTPIVGFCNLIQVLRGVLFDIGSLSPQLTWSNDAAPHPALFSADDPTTMKRLAEQDEIVIIIPCQEGEEESYIATDPHLGEIIASGVMRNVLSPMAAKGLEFSRVVLYKFGHECISQYPNLHKAIVSRITQTDPDLSLPMEYFVNRLYVAASRPKRRLFVVDSRDAIDELWSAPALRDTSALLRCLPHADSKGWEEAHLATLRPGVDEDWTADRDDPLTLAEQFFSQGRSTRNAYLLQMAEANFKRAAAPRRALECAAYRLELQESFAEAGRAFWEISRLDDAVRCFWRGESFADLASIADTADRPEIRAARFMVSDGGVDECEAMLLYMANLTTAGTGVGFLGRPWRAVMERLVKQLAGIAKDADSVERYFSQIREIEAVGVNVPHSVEYGDIAYSAGHYAVAVVCWAGSAGLKDSERRKRHEHARAFSEPFPQNLQWLKLLGRNDLIVQEIGKRSAFALDSEMLAVVITASVSEQSIEDAVDWCRSSDNPVWALNELVAASSALLIETRQDELVLEAMKLALSKGDWDAGVSIASDVRYSDARREAFEQWLVVEIANSNQLAHHARKEDRERVARYLSVIADHLVPGESDRMKALGAAFERTGQIVKSLTFYESVWKRRDEAWPPADRRYAEQRWIRCKLRQAERSRLANKRLDARDQERDAEIRLHSLAVRLTEIPDIVVIDALATGKSLAIPRAELSGDQVRAARDLAKASSQWTAASIGRMLGVPEELVERALLE
ncbi:MAG: hypothetical protein WEE89_15875 [Gemmatimonadota bacterium]